MNKILIVCGLLMVSSIALAQEATTETCANGAGTVVIGKVSGHKYCKSNETMNWWNAWSWCDAQGRQSFSMDDCGCDGLKNCVGICPELVVNGSGHVWTSTPNGTTKAEYVEISYGSIKHNYERGWTAYYALCK